MGIIFDEEVIDEWFEVMGWFFFMVEEINIVEDWLIYYMKDKNIFVLFGFYKVWYFDDGMLLKCIVWICDRYMNYCFYYGIVEIL